jgi:hypothetical protein
MLVQYVIVILVVLKKFPFTLICIGLPLTKHTVSLQCTAHMNSEAFCWSVMKVKLLGIQVGIFLLSKMALGRLFTTDTS